MKSRPWLGSLPGMNPGIHLLHKPEGPTSFSLVQACMETIPAREGKRRPRVCHGGTLDPFASGLLLILVEPATRLFDHLHAVPKVYDATVRWGIETDNGDPGGKVTFTGDSSGLERAAAGGSPCDVRRLARSNPTRHQRQADRWGTGLPESAPGRNGCHAPVARCICTRRGGLGTICRGRAGCK